MRKMFTRVRKACCKNKLLLTFAVILLVSSLSFILMSYLIGPAKNGFAVTGAPFNSSQTCAKTGCHSGGSYGGSINLQLLDATNTAVTSYNPGSSYTFRITLNHTTATPKGYGFQTTVATSGANTDINTWGTLPANTHIKLLSQRNYVEHSNVLTTNVINIPWTAPAAKTGSLVFYTAGNLVDKSGNTSGDQPVNTSITITENTTLPVRLNYFKGALVNGHAVLNWSTAAELNNKSFIIEKSTNGSDFADIATIPCKGNSDGSNYSYTDYGFSNIAYYRLKQTDFDGRSTTYNTVELREKSAVQYSLNVYAHAGNTGLIFHNGGQAQNITVRYNDLQGRLIRTGTIFANAGDNMIGIPSGLNKSVIIVSVITQDGSKTSTKIGIQR